MAEIYYHCPSNFSTLAKGLGWDHKEIKAQKKNMKEQGHKISLVKYVQEDPQRDEFVAKFQKDEAFRKHVDMGFAFGKKSSQEDIDKYVTKYKNHAIVGPDFNITPKDKNKVVTINLYALGHVVGDKTAHKAKIKMADGDVDTFKANDPVPGFCPYDPTHDEEELAEDVTLIAAFGEAALLKCMRRRHCEIYNFYTYVSDIVLVLNPYMGLPEFCIGKKYPNQEHFVKGINPCVNATGHFAYWGQMDPTAEPRQQSCIVSGESGAGKTVSANNIMKYLAKLSDGRKMEQGTYVKPVKGSGKADITALVAGVSPFLEAFGNAKTNMNDNSSRFGKFTKILFKDGKIVGAQLVHYLLEKDRLVNLGFNERNYHVFYFLLRGGSPDELKQLFTNGKVKALDYVKLREGEFGEPYGMKPYPEFGPDQPDPTLVGHGKGPEHDVYHMNHILEPDPDDSGIRAALSSANVSDEDQNNMWKIVAGCLRMSAIEFAKVDDEQGKFKDQVEPAEIAKLLGFPTDGDDSMESLVCCAIIHLPGKPPKEIRKK